MNELPAVLLVEDDMSHAALVMRWLAPIAEVHHVSRAHDAIAALVDGDWDMVLSDVLLPDIDGVEVARVCREHSPETPVLLMTGGADVSLAARAVEQGVRGYLLKPLGRRELIQRVTVLCREREEIERGRRVVLAIGAHPDDVELGCGGALAAHTAAGDAVVILTLSRGAEGGVATQRERESERAAQRLGALLVMYDLPDTRISAGAETIQAIAEVIAEVRPDTVYVHSEHDRHQDHRAVHQATRVAARDVPNLYCYQSPSSTVAFAPTRFVSLGDHLEHKLLALGEFETQGSRSYLTAEQVRADAIYWGRFAGHQPVEPFEVIREAVAVASPPRPVRSSPPVVRLHAVAG